MGHKLLDQIKDLELPDQTKQPEFKGWQPPDEGRRPARLVAYVELGMRKQSPYNGQPKPNCLRAMLLFELFGKNDANDNENSQSQQKVHTERVWVKYGDRANYSKLLKKMSGGRQVTHMAQLLGHGFLLTLKHNKVTSKKEDGSSEERTYANMRTKDDGWLISPPVMRVYSGEDDLEGTMRKVKVPEPTEPLRLLLWGNPTKEQWDSCYIDGEREIKDEDGNVIETRSKNFIQEMLVEAEDYEGSPLQEIVEAGGLLNLKREEEEVDIDEEQLKKARTAKAARVRKAAAQKAEQERKKKLEEEYGDPEDIPIDDDQDGNVEIDSLFDDLDDEIPF